MGDAGAGGAAPSQQSKSACALAGALGDHTGEVWPSSWASLRPCACECQVELA